MPDQLIAHLVLHFKDTKIAQTVEVAETGGKLTNRHKLMAARLLLKSFVDDMVNSGAAGDRIVQEVGAEYSLLTCSMRNHLGIITTTEP